MCGFAGYFIFNNKPEKDNHNLSQMMVLQKHRGPDDSGMVGINTASGFYEEVSGLQEIQFKRDIDLLFGFNRLSILDLSPNGHQPMFNQNKNVVLMLNGEVYNAFDYKEELESKGFRFKSSSDTEVALYLYEAYGMEGMLKRLNGMFALAIYDFRDKKLRLARDRFGIKPLYILRQNGLLAFSSEMKSFKALPQVKLEADYAQLDEFLLFRNLIHDTLFKGVHNLLPGTFLEIDASGAEQKKEFYQINEEQSDVYKGSKAKELIEQSLAHSVQRQMISDVKLGCQLSGGVDSSLVTFFAADTLPKGKLETISIVFDDQRFSEKRYIEQVAHKLKLQAHQFTMHADYYFNVMEKATWHFEQPLNHPNTIGIFLLSQEARKYVTVLLSGEGADECLAGYSRFLAPSKISLKSREFWGQLKRNRTQMFPYLRSISQADNRLVLGGSFSSFATASALRSDFSWEKALKRRKQIWKTMQGDPLQRHRKYELLTYLPDLLMRQDKMSMAHSIENRVPFLDNEMVAASLAVSGEDLIRKRQGKMEGKYVLKEICADKFSENFAYREKMGFGIPLRAFMSSRAFQEKWNNQWLPGIKRRDIFETDAIETWFKKINSAGPDELDAIWMMTGFEVWAQQYVD